MERLDVKGYQAKVVQYKIQGRELPSMEELILGKLASGEILKKEEIDDYVSKKTGIFLNDDLRGYVSGALKKFEKENEVIHVDHGYWKKVSKRPE